MEEKSSSPTLSNPHPFRRSSSYVDHLAHVQNIPNPLQTQYMNYTHSIAWTFTKDKKRN